MKEPGFLFKLILITRRYGKLKYPYAKALLLLVLVNAFCISAASHEKNRQLQPFKSTDKLQVEDGEAIFMLTYFRQRYPTRIEIDEDGNTIEVPLPDPMLVAKLHVALSNDGRHWFPLNDNQPIWDHWMRDPYVRRGPDGKWRVLSTGTEKDYDRKKTGPGCLFFTSDDLIHWKVEGTLPLMKDVLDESGNILARNIWAPEWFYDEENEEYVLIWSSSFKDAGWKESKLWFSRTNDWKNFTPAKVFFEPSYSVIDGTLLKHDNTYYLFHKEEEFGAKTGERRAIRVATSANLEGPYNIIDGYLNQGQIVPVITEGPTIIKDPVKPGWILYYDYCMTNRFGSSYSPDLLNWKVEEDVNFPADARHGCVTKITTEEAQSLIDAYKISDDSK